jgi:hypothetical protein
VLREPWQSTYDPDLDLPPQPQPPNPVESLKAYQRLVVNPFLAVLSGVGVFTVVRGAVQTRSLTLFFIGIGLMPVPFLLLQFHCLDCGATGWLLRYRRHACPAVVVRWQSRQLRRFHGPRLGAQLQIWSYLLVSALVLGLILLRH